jgi:hypothetical protein
MNIKNKLTSLVSCLRFWPQRARVVRHFGGAKLVKLPNGHHELRGGTDTDRLAAYEWTSLRAPEIVFTHFHREAGVGAPRGGVRSPAGRLTLRPPLWKWWPVGQCR